MYDSLQVVHMLPLRSSAQHSSFRSPNPTLIAELRILGCLGVRIDRLFAKKLRWANEAEDAKHIDRSARAASRCS